MRIPLHVLRSAILIVSCLAATRAADIDDINAALDRLAAVRSDGTGNAEAAAAWRVVSRIPPARLADVLRAMDRTAGPLGRNWLRAAFETAVDRTLDAGKTIPAAPIETFLWERQHVPLARELAYSLLVRLDPRAARKLLPRLLDDPSVELRRRAVAVVIDRAERLLEANDRAAAVKALQRALLAARDKDQVQHIARQLRKLGRDVDLPRHFGFLTHWRLIGPFDNSARAGYATRYPPEKELDAEGVYDGKEGRKVRWIEYTTTDDFGMVDLNKPLGKKKEVVGYAWTTFHADRPRRVELRLGCKNAWKLWLNGKLVFARDEYHRGMKMDQYRFPVELKAGPNEILVKVCQNEQVEPWTVEWQFQLRVCDATGTAILPAGDSAR